MITKIHNFFSQAYNLTKQVPTERKEDSYEGVTVWGFDSGSSQTRDGYTRSRNDFPQQIIQDVYNSPVASACLELWVEFLAGDGFLDGLLNDEKVNPEGDTKKQILRKVAYDVAHLEGFALHIGYNMEGEVTEIHHQPFEQTRIGKISKTGKAQDIKTNPYFGIPQDFDRKYTKSYYTFNPDPAYVREEMRQHAEMRRQGKVKNQYPGQMFWVSIEKPLARIYPQPFYYSGINWFKIDAEVQKFHERNLKNNLIQSHVLNVYGDPDELVGEDDENGDKRITRGERFNRELSQSARGASFGGGQWINWYQGEDEKLKPEAFPTNANDQLFQTLQDLTTSQIAIACKTPTILVGIQQAGKLGNSQEVINSVKIMQSTVTPKKDFISANLAKVFKAFDGKDADYYIKNINYVNTLPEWAFEGDVMTTKEKREYLNENFNLELAVAQAVKKTDEDGNEMETPDTEEPSSRFSEFGVGGVQGILEIQKAVAEGTASEEAAIKTLMIIYGFDEQTSRDMLGIGDTETIEEKPKKQEPEPDAS